MEDAYRIRKAEPEDADFLGHALCCAERAHTGIGTWDILCPGGAEKVFAKACKESESCFFHYSRFFIAEETSTGTPAAAMCYFLYPEFSVTKAKPGLVQAMLDLGFISSLEEGDVAWDRTSYLDDAYPDLDYNNKWMIESVYTHPDHRGKGLAYKLMATCRAAASSIEPHDFFISCAVGNEAAFNLYRKVGFSLLGTGHSDACMTAIGSTGFHVLELKAESERIAV